MHKSSGYYILRHRPTGYYYIGSSGGVLRRVDNHRSLLSRGLHPNKILQRVYTIWDDIEVEVFPTLDLNEARAGEQHAINTHHTDERCCNIALDISDHTKGVITDEMRRAGNGGRAGAGRTLSETHRQRIGEGRRGQLHSDEARNAISESKSVPVFINGVRYSSALRAGIELGVSAQVIRYRIRNVKYPEYTY